MTDAVTELVLALLCTDLGFLRANLPDEVLELLKAKIAQAEQRIAGAGVDLSAGSLADADLIASYAAWLYRGRVQQLAMPIQLRWLLKNRQAHDLMKESAT